MFPMMMWKTINARRVLADAIMAHAENSYSGDRHKKKTRARVVESSTESSDDESAKRPVVRKRSGAAGTAALRVPEVRKPHALTTPARMHASDTEPDQSGKEPCEGEGDLESGTVTDGESQAEPETLVARRKVRRHARRAATWSPMLSAPRNDVNTSEAEQSDLTSHNGRVSRKNRIRAFLSEKTGKTVARTVRICGRLLEISRLPPTLKRLVKHRLRRQELRDSTSRFRPRSPVAMLIACVLFSLTILLPVGSVLNWLRRMSLKPEADNHSMTMATVALQLPDAAQCSTCSQTHAHSAQFDDYIVQLRAGFLLPSVKDPRFRKALERRLSNMKSSEAPTPPWNVFGLDRRANLTVSEFVAHYDGVWPVIITDCVPRWPAYSKWDAAYLERRHGDSLVTVKSVRCDSDAACETQASVETLAEFIHSLNSTSSSSNWRYLQDELLIERYADLLADVGLQTMNENNTEETRPVDLPAGNASVCELLRGSLFDLLPDTVRPWRSHFLWGTAGSRSSLHIDPYNWTGTVSVVRGRKRWALVAPGQEWSSSCNAQPSNRTCPATAKPGHCDLRSALCVEVGESHFPLNCNSYVSSLDLFSSDGGRQTACAWHNVRVLEAEQSAGEVLVVPSGWFHQALNVESSLAVAGELLTEANHLVVLTEALKRNPEIAVAVQELLADRGRTIVQLSDAEVRDLHRTHSVVRDWLAARAVRRFAERIPDSVRQRGARAARDAFEAYAQNARSRD